VVSEKKSERDSERVDEGLPFPDSLCHRCAAPVRVIRTARSTFLYCPKLKRYPPQPVGECEAFVPKPSEPGGATS